MTEIAKMLVSKLNTDIGVLLVALCALGVAGLSIYFAILVVQKGR